MRVLLLLPELEEGGVERHVVDLAAGLVERGHTVGVVSEGGPLEAQLPEAVRRITLPVARKNPLTGLRTALRLARLVRREGWNLLHAHSRVPAWLCWWASRLCGAPWGVTCHARYSKNYGIYPLRFADGALCVSRSVCDHLRPFLPENTVVVRNGLSRVNLPRREAGKVEEARLLFVGRLTKIKGPDFLLRVLGRLKAFRWRLDVVGDGPLLPVLREQAEGLGMADRVVFHGFRDDVPRFLAAATCLLAPSRDEGLGMAFLEAVGMGVPLFASHLAAFEECAAGEGFLPPEDEGAWAEALRGCLAGERPFPNMSLCVDLDPKRWLDETVAWYEHMLKLASRRVGAVQKHGGEGGTTS